MVSLLPATHDHAVGLLVAAGAVAECRLAPWGLRVPTGAAATLAASVRVVERVHGHAAHRGPPAPPTRLARLADVLVLVVGVADLAHGGEAADVDPPDLPGGHPHGGEVALLGDQLGRDAGAAHQLAAPAGEHLEVVDGRAERDVGERQGVAGLDLGADTGADDGPDGQPQGGEDVPLLAVGVVQEGDPGAPVGVVLDRRDPGDHVALGAPEVDHPVELGMAAPAVTHRDPAGVVAAARLLEVDGEAALRGGAGHLLEGADGHEPAASTGRLVLVDWHRSTRPRTVRGSSAREPASPPPSSNRGSSRSAGCRCRAGTGGCAPCRGRPWGWARAR